MLRFTRIPGAEKLLVILFIGAYNRFDDYIPDIRSSFQNRIRLK